MDSQVPSSPEHDLSEGLAALSRGDHSALRRVLPLVYATLKSMARERMRRERPEHTLEPTALVHEAFLRLGSGVVAYRDESHFFAVAARAMREVLIDHARTHGRDKRGGGRVRVTLNEQDVEAPAARREIDLITLNDALARFAEHDEIGAGIVEMRFFAGMEVERIAAVLGVTDRTVRRHWVYAKAWLMRAMTSPDLPLGTCESGEDGTGGPGTGVPDE